MGDMTEWIEFTGIDPDEPYYCELCGCVLEVGEEAKIRGGDEIMYLCEACAEERGAI